MSTWRIFGEGREDRIAEDAFDPRLYFKIGNDFKKGAGYNLKTMHLPLVQDF